MNHFEVGEIAIDNAPTTGVYHSDRVVNVYYGEECEITDPLDYHINFTDHPVYGIRYSDGAEAWVHPRCLKKKPPKDDEASWDRIQEVTDWNPTKIEVLA